ncbi:MAG: nicotinate (nicotinamide) nucleotide adenylyltransferase [Verrucomicrobiota bacterium]
MSTEPNIGPGSLALFGGTFDPIHNGHLFLARRAYELCQLDQVLFLPCFQSPHKEGVQSAPGPHRLAMIEAAIEGHPEFAVSGHELQQKGPSYSWQTAEYFHTKWPETELFWLLGIDQWKVIERWARSDYLATLVSFIVFPRDGIKPEDREGYRSIRLPDERFDLSATDIREALTRGESIAGKTAPAVETYLREHRLYGDRDH